MLIEQALMTYLLAQSGVISLVGDRIHFMVAPQETAKPYIIISKIDSPDIASHDGPTGLERSRFQLSAFAATYGSAKEISAALKTTLAGYSGNMGGTGGRTVTIAAREDESDLYEETTQLFHVASDYIILHR